MYNLTLSTAYRFYTDHCRASGSRPSSLSMNEYAYGYLKEYLMAEVGSEDVPLERLDRLTLRSFLLWLQDTKGLSSSTAQRIYDVLKAMYNHLLDEEFIEVSPVRRLEKPQRNHSHVESLAIEQIQDMVDLCDERTFTGLRNKLIVTLLYDTGVRATELCTINVGDVVLSERKIILRHTKTGDPRYAYYNSNAAKLLAKYLALRNADAADRLIVTRQGGAGDKDWLRHMLLRLGAKAGLHSNPHRFRHSCGVSSLVNGSDVETVRRVLGHSNPRMTLHYAHLSDAEVQVKHAQTSPADKLNISNKRYKKNKGETK